MRPFVGISSIRLKRLPYASSHRSVCDACDSHRKRVDHIRVGGRLSGDVDIANLQWCSAQSLYARYGYREICEFQFVRRPGCRRELFVNVICGSSSSTHDNSQFWAIISFSSTCIFVCFMHARMIRLALLALTNTLKSITKNINCLPIAKSIFGFGARHSSNRWMRLNKMTDKGCTLIT